jgi:hypothetical protein
LVMPAPGRNGWGGPRVITLRQLPDYVRVRSSKQVSLLEESRATDQC